MLNLDIDGVFANMQKGVSGYLPFRYDTNPKDAWGILDQVDHLFLGFEPYYGAKSLFDFLYRYRYVTNGVRILGAAPDPTNKLVTAVEDKISWARKYLSEDIDIVITQGWKGKLGYVDRGDILIDDSTRNIEAWTDSGGIGLLHNPDRPLRTYTNFVNLVNRAR